MTVALKLAHYLEAEGIPFERLPHDPSYTAQTTAQMEHVPGKMEAKVVMVKLDEKDAMAVLPSIYRVDLEELRGVAGAREARLTTEMEFARLFPDCEPGAMPPFGHLYGLPVYMDRTLAQNEQIVFNGGTHEEGIQMSFRDYERLARPTVCTFAVQREGWGELGFA